MEKETINKIIREKTGIDRDNFYSCLNAMHSAEECLSGNRWADYFSWLQRNGKATGVRATAPERAEGFLRAFGLWKD